MKKQFTLITIAIISSIGILSVLEAPDEAPLVETDPHFVDAYVKDFTMVSMNENGRPGYTLTANLMEHFNDTGESEISEPVFNINREDNIWVISARNGIIDDDYTWVTLEDDVVMLEKGSEIPLKLKTSKIRFNTKTQVANSDRPVDITKGSMSIKSKGMKFNNITGRLELLANVNGTYVKN